MKDAYKQLQNALQALDSEQMTSWLLVAESGNSFITIHYGSIPQFLTLSMVTLKKAMELLANLEQPMPDDTNSTTH